MAHRYSRSLAFAFAVALLPLGACGGGGGTSGGPGGGTPTGPDISGPSVVVEEPRQAVAGLPGDGFQVTWRADDDRDAVVRVVLDVDGDPLTMVDQTTLFTGTDQNGTAVSQAVSAGNVAPGRYTLFVIVDDGTNPPAADGGTPILVYPGLAGVAPTRRNLYGVTGRWVVFSVGESEHGATVLNGDNDIGDGVMAVLDTQDGTVVPTGISADVTTPPGRQPTAHVLPSETDGIAWPRRETDAGQVLNGDPDTLDTVVAFVAPKLGLAAASHPVGGATLATAGTLGRRFVLYRESSHGRDINGDNDALDDVVSILDYRTNQLTTLAWSRRAGTGLSGNGFFAAYFVDEGTEGTGNTGVVLNGDGDTLDTLVLLTDASGAAVGLAPSNADWTAALAVADNAPVAAYSVDEALANTGVPMNGDLDLTDFIPSYLVGPAQTVLSMPGPGLDARAGAPHIHLDGHRLLYTVKEEPLVDYNGDFDTADGQILFWSDTSLPAPIIVPVSVPSLGRPGLALDGGSSALVAPGWISLVVSETANNLDLTSDGDTGDAVLLLVDLTGGLPVVHNTGLIPLNPSTLALPGATIPVTGVGGDSGLVVQAAETANGDLNGDGDTTDVLAYYFDFSAPTNPVPLADTGALHAAIRQGSIALTAAEILTGSDHDGNGRSTDFVLRVFDLTGAVLEPGRLASEYSVPASEDGTFWVWLRSEVAEGRDLNADADILDQVLGIWLR